MKNGKVVNKDKVELWYKDGVLHRLDGPAVIYPCGSQSWYNNGKLHKEDGPAFTGKYGKPEWWLNGVYYPNYESH